MQRGYVARARRQPAKTVIIPAPGSQGSARDVAGNQATTSCAYVVKYAFLGFKQPIPPSSIRRGSTIPLKFRLGDAIGATIPDTEATAMAGACLVEVTLDGSIQGCASYDAAADTFQRDVKTSKTLERGLHTVGIRVQAGGVVVNTDQVIVQVK